MYSDWKLGQRDKQNAIEWAKGMLTQDFRILDTETTGLGNAEIVEIAIIDPHGQPLVNSLIRPSIPIPADVTAIHGIDDGMVANAPTLPDVWGDIQTAIAGKTLLIYNAPFDLRILDYCAKLHHLPLIAPAETDCIMRWYAVWFGAWSAYHQDYRWQKLSGGHRALGDCQAALAYLHRMVEIKPDPDSDQNPDPLDCIPF